MVQCLPFVFLIPLSLQTFPEFSHLFLSLRFRTACKCAACAPIDPSPFSILLPLQTKGSFQFGPSGRGAENTQGAATDGAWEQWAVPLGPGGAGRSLARPPLNLTPVNFRTPQALPSATHACTPVSPHHPHTGPAAMTPAPARLHRTSRCSFI